MPRTRRTREQLAALQSALYQLAEQLHPLTVRSLFYRAVSIGAIDKTEKEYRAVVKMTGKMRKSGLMPYHWLVDASRFCRQVNTWKDPESVLNSAKNGYVRNKWVDQPRRVEIWTEKDAVIGTIEPVCSKWEVPLYSCRGYASLSLLYDAIQMWPDDKPVCMRYFGDLDPSGADIPRFIQHEIYQMTGAPVDFRVCAVVDEQVKEYELQTRPTKKSDSRSKTWVGESVELDAFDPNDLRALVEKAITEELDRAVWAKSLEVEKEDRKQLKKAVDVATGKAKPEKPKRLRYPI